MKQLLNSKYGRPEKVSPTKPLFYNSKDIGDQNKKKKGREEDENEEENNIFMKLRKLENDIWGRDGFSDLLYR